MPSHHLRFIYILQGHCSQRRQLKGGKTGEVRLSVFLLVIFYIKIIPTPDITKDFFLLNENKVFVIPTYLNCFSISPIFTT